MFTLKSFPSAAFIQEKMKAGDVFATVIEGKFKNTVGKITRVDRKHYDRHDYFLEVNGQVHKFCGSILKESSDHEVALVLDSAYQREFRDFNDRVITMGNVLILTKPSNKSSTQEVIIGNVKKIDDTGVYVEPFAINGAYLNDSAKYVKVVKTISTIILDGSTVHSCMIQRLSAQ